MVPRRSEIPITFGGKNAENVASGSGGGEVVRFFPSRNGGGSFPHKKNRGRRKAISIYLHSVEVVNNG